MSDKQATEEKPRVHLMFVGVAKGEGGKLLEEFKEVELKDGGWVFVAGKDSRFYSKLRTTMPGCIVSVCHNPENPSSIYPATTKFVSQWNDDDDRVKWTAAWRAATDANKEAKAAKEAMKENAAAERLEPFRAAYRKLNTEGRRQMIAEVLRVITTNL